MLRRPKRSKNHVGKNAISNSAISGAVKVSTSASAPVLGDLLKRFTSGQDRHGHDSHDDGDVSSPADRHDEEVNFSFYTTCIHDIDGCMFVL